MAGCDQSAARTLALRVRATLALRDAQVRDLRNDVLRMGEDRKFKSSPLTAAVLALGQLTVDDQGQVFSAYAAGLVATLRTRRRSHASRHWPRRRRSAEPS